MSLLLLIVGCVALVLLWQEVRGLRERVEMLEACVTAEIPAAEEAPPAVPAPPEPFQEPERAAYRLAEPMVEPVVLPPVAPVDPPHEADVE